MIGRSLSHYEILSQLGQGGMGQVYLAQDTTLDRKVALKVLPPELATGRGRRARFEREAKAIAALNHPNIVTIYSVEEAEGLQFLTLEWVDGETLAETLKAGPMEVTRILELATTLAEALRAAHERGISHRDLKPSNVM
ncbi:MAG: serine/threonine protein kinase, partial [bacterium]|nr:serine/threonine protein kinase [bacterium]